MNLRFLSIEAEEIQTAKLHRASGPNSIFPSPSMDSKKDGLSPAVRPVLPSGRTDWAVRNTGAGWSYARGTLSLLQSVVDKPDCRRGLLDPDESQ